MPLPLFAAQRHADAEHAPARIQIALGAGIADAQARAQRDALVFRMQAVQPQCVLAPSQLPARIQLPGIDQLQQPGRRIATLREYRQHRAGIAHLHLHLRIGLRGRRRRDAPLRHAQRGPPVALFTTVAVAHALHAQRAAAEVETLVVQFRAPQPRVEIEVAGQRQSGRLQPRLAAAHAHIAFAHLSGRVQVQIAAERAAAAEHAHLRCRQVAVVGAQVRHARVVEAQPRLQRVVHRRQGASAVQVQAQVLALHEDRLGVGQRRQREAVHAHSDLGARLRGSADDASGGLRLAADAHPQHIGRGLHLGHVEAAARLQRALRQAQIGRYITAAVEPEPRLAHQQVADPVQRFEMPAPLQRAGQPRQQRAGVVEGQRSSADAQVGVEHAARIDLPRQACAQPDVAIDIEQQRQHAAIGGADAGMQRHPPVELAAGLQFAAQQAQVRLHMAEPGLGAQARLRPGGVDAQRHAAPVQLQRQVGDAELAQARRLRAVVARKREARVHMRLVGDLALAVAHAGVVEHDLRREQLHRPALELFQETHCAVALAFDRQVAEAGAAQRAAVDRVEAQGPALVALRRRRNRVGDTVDRADHVHRLHPRQAHFAAQQRQQRDARAGAIGAQGPYIALHVAAHAQVPRRDEARQHGQRRPGVHAEFFRRAVGRQVEQRRVEKHVAQQQVQQIGDQQPAQQQTPRTRPAPVAVEGGVRRETGEGRHHGTIAAPRRGPRESRAATAAAPHTRVRRDPR